MARQLQLSRDVTDALAFRAKYVGTLRISPEHRSPPVTSEEARKIRRRHGQPIQNGVRALVAFHTSLKRLPSFANRKRMVAIDS
jgi:hypothetical protein